MPSFTDDRGDEAQRRPSATVRAMEEGDLEAVLAIETRSFRSPWQRHHFVHELRGNPFARSVVLEVRGALIGYAAVWVVDDELRINNIAIAAGRRGQGFGRLLLRRLFDEARAAGCRRATLEVRPSNEAALALYRSEGFRTIGKRRNYYALEGEDAIVMERALEPLPR